MILIDPLFNSSETRLARALLLLGRFGEEGKRESFEVPKVMHQVLATSSAQPRARNSFIMNKFRELEFIAYNGGLRIKRLLLDVILHD